MVVGFGDPDQHHQVLARLAATLPPLFEFEAPVPFVVLQQMLDEANSWGFHCYEKSTYIEDLSDAVIDVITDRLPRKNSPLTVQLFYRLDGAYCDVGDDDTAFGGERSPRYAVFIVGVCPTPELLAAERTWVRAFWDALLPHSAGIGSYVNAMAEQEGERVRAAYGPAKFQRLARIKTSYDPDNIFHRNANIEPG